MKPISKRDQERLAKRQALSERMDHSSDQAAPEGGVNAHLNSVEIAVLDPPRAAPSPAPHVEVLPTPTPTTAPAPVVSHAPDLHGQQRAQGAGVSKILGNLKTGLADQLNETKAALATAEHELDELRPLKDMADGKAIPVRDLDPRTVRPTSFENRDGKSFDAENDRDFKSFLADIRAKGGNTVPGFVRPLPAPQGTYLYEAVYGHRRLAACLEAGVLFKTLVAGVSDEQAVLLQQTENSHRKKLSAIENGRQIASYLARFRDRDTGRASDGSIQMLAAALKSEPKYVGKLALIGSIPDEVLKVIPDIRDIPFRPALLLARACRDNLKQVTQLAQTIPDGSKSRTVVQHLLGTSHAASTPPGRYELSLPADADEREAIVRDLRALESKYGIRLGLKALDAA